MVDIQFCPCCGQQGFSVSNDKHWRCPSCGFQYFHNVAAATGAIIVCGDEILLARRDREPGKGKLDLPGGFVDYDETTEQGLEREIQEELGLTGLHWRYLCSFPNDYFFAEVHYRTLDAVFVSELQTKPEVQALDDVAEVCWVKKSELDLSQMAFESAKRALRVYLQESN